MIFMVDVSQRSQCTSTPARSKLAVHLHAESTGNGEVMLGAQDLEEQAIAHLHDVRLVHSCHPLPVVQVCVAKRVLCRSP